MAPKSEDFTVVDGPVLVDGSVIARLIQWPDGSGRVETWDGKRWEPGGATIPEVLKGTPVSDPEGTLTAKLETSKVLSGSSLLRPAGDGRTLSIDRVNTYASRFTIAG